MTIAYLQYKKKAIGAIVLFTFFEPKNVDKSYCFLSE